MKTVFIISEYIFVAPKTKVKKYRFVQNLLGKVAEKESKTEKSQTVEYYKWFDTVEEAENYLESL